jgi:hypothetical protein
VISLSLVLLTILALQGAVVEGTHPVLGLHGPTAETFLREAEIIALEPFETKGVTKPMKATLSDGEHTLHAVFKDIDERIPESKMADGRSLFNLRDSYKHEIASYELDKLLGLGIVPPTVERRIEREVGSLQLWVEGSMTEWTRKKVEKLSPPDMTSWNDQVSTIKTYLQLIWDTDSHNISNVMVDTGWRLWKIDASRAFYADRKLRKEASLQRFSRRLLAALEALDRSRLETALEPWLDRRQIKTLWQRRARILELADERVAELGEAAVLYD